MASDNVIELSSESSLSPLPENFLEDYILDKDDVPGCSNQDFDRGSSPLDEYTKKIENIFNRSALNASSDSDSAGYLEKAKASHDISSSEEDIKAIEGLDSGYDCKLSGSYNSQNTSFTSSQSSTLTQDKDGIKAAKAAERQRKKQEKDIARAAKQKEMEERKRLRAELNREKLAEKLAKKQDRFKRNQMKPNECLKYMTLVVDEKLFKTVLCSKAVESFPHPTVKFSYKDQPIENSITWTRSELEGGEIEENWVAIMWPAEDVVKAISESTLVSQFKHISSALYPGKNILLLIFAMEHYRRKYQNYHNSKRKNNTQHNGEEEASQRQSKSIYLTGAEIELGLVKLQLLAGVSHRHFEDYGEFADILGQFTRAIAEIPYKKEREEVDKEMGWYVRSFNKNCVRSNKDMQGLDRLWIQHLSVYNKTNVDTAKAIASVYPTPTALIEAYENCDSQREKELLLQNIQVKRSGSDSAISRRLGPELSKKICLTFTNMDGNIKLSSKT